MLVFPQLATGAAALYPVIRKTRMRTVINVLEDGRRVAFADPDGESRQWVLKASGLTVEEWNAIESLFAAVSGRWKTFTLLDPASNLLAQSENFEDAVWTKGPLIELTTGQSDPLGTARATTAANSGGSIGGVTQVLSVPGGFQYSMSVWARSTAGALLTLSATGGSLSTSQVVLVGATWRRYSLFVGLAQTSATSVTFGVQIPAGMTVDLFAAQAEAQPGVSDYKKTGSRGGVYDKARFAADELTVTARGSDVFDAAVDIVTVGA